MKKNQQRHKSNVSRGGGRGGRGGGSNSKRKTPAIGNDPFFNDKTFKQKRGKGEEIHSSEEDNDDFVDRNGEEEDEDVALEDTETADDKRLKLAKAYLDKIREITKDQDEENEEDEDEEGRRGKRDSLVAEILQQEQLEESSRVQHLLASRYFPSSFKFIYRIDKILFLAKVIIGRMILKVSRARKLFLDKNIEQWSS